MKLLKWGRLFICVALFGFIACENMEEGDFKEDESGEMNDLEIDVVQKSLLDDPYDRADYMGKIELHPGFWGEWYTEMCPEGTFATHYKLRVETQQGKGDDTALNAIKLYCMRKNGTGNSFAVPHEGLWGTWSSWESCGTNRDGTRRFMIGGQMRVEKKQGGDNSVKSGLQNDDTAANDVHMKCENGGTIEADREGPWGDWYQARTCPNNTAVCGLSVRFESAQGSGDDTAMNGLRLHCCYQMIPLRVIYPF